MKCANRSCWTLNGPKISQQVLWAILIMLLLIGCGAPNATPTASSPATATVEVIPTASSPATVEVIPTSIQEIVDVWEGKVLTKKAYYHFREDGALFVAYTFDKLHNDPISLVPAQYWFEGETFHIEDDCGHGTYLLTLTMEDGRRRKLSFQLIDDTCEQRIADFETPMRYMRPY